jgi:deoxyribose-phosphate aldolase
VTEAANLVDLGAQEIDIGVPIGLLKANQDTELYADLVAIVDAVKPIPVKAMLELPLLTAAERDRIVDLAVQAGVSYLKNASAGSVGVATPEDIAYLRARAPAHVKVKASGGIKTYEQVQALIAAGADVVGTSAAVAIIQGRDSVVKHEY